VALPAAAVAKDYKTNTAVEGGYLWFFAYDTHASHIDIVPTWCVGATLFQVVDFKWARNMVGELNYFYAKARGEAFDLGTSATAIFDLSMHHMAFNVGYIFEGRRLHPYLSAGVGAGYVVFDRYQGKTTSEWDPVVNLSPGVDYTVWETGRPALERLDVGFRVRYEYIFQQRVVNAALNSVALMARLNLRW
jgi:hypothetical protein